MNMPDPIHTRISRFFGSPFDLTLAEQEEARASAGKPWRTGYYVASRDWPVPPPGMLTLEEAYAAVKVIGMQAEVRGDG